MSLYVVQNTYKAVLLKKKYRYLFRAGLGIQHLEKGRFSKLSRFQNRSI